MGKTHDGSPRVAFHFAWQDEKIVGIQVTEQLQAERDTYFAKQLEKIRALAVVEPCRELSSMNEGTKSLLLRYLADTAPNRYCSLKSQGGFYGQTISFSLALP